MSTSSPPLGHNATLTGVRSWQPEPTQRGSWSIISTCLCTLVISVWSAIHVDIFPRRQKRAVLEKVRWFLVGLFESSFFPVVLYVLGSWYTKTELAKRVAIFHVTAPLGTAFGGYLQAAVYTNLDGVHGLTGWRWLYIICGVRTVVRYLL